MAHKQRKCISSPACTIAMAGGKKHTSSKHALLVASFAKRQGLSFEGAAELLGRAVDVLLSKGERPTSLLGFAESIGSSVEQAADLMDALVAFGYLHPAH